MTHSKKTEILEKYLSQSPGNYRDTFKTDLYLFFNEDFTTENKLLKFLYSFENEIEIHEWVDFVTSQIVLKFDEEVEQIDDFIYGFTEIKKA